MRGLQSIILVLNKLRLYIALGPTLLFTKIRIFLTRSQHQHNETNQTLSMLDGLNEARRDFLLTQKYYNSVTDNELIDYAIYRMLAAQSKYSYFLAKARLHGATKGLENQLIAAAIKKDMQFYSPT